jgi:DNA replicative helicase MCM subunit Mcm2 (Cdc46/Mcm family)
LTSQPKTDRLLEKAKTNRTAFWDDLAKDLEDPEFLREYVAESIRISETVLTEKLETLIEEWRESLREDGDPNPENARGIWDYDRGIIQGLLLAKDLIKES